MDSWAKKLRFRSRKPQKLRISEKRNESFLRTLRGKKFYNWQKFEHLSKGLRPSFPENFHQIFTVPVFYLRFEKVSSFSAKCVHKKGPGYGILFVKRKLPTLQDSQFSGAKILINMLQNKNWSIETWLRITGVNFSNNFFSKTVKHIF